MHSPPSPRRRTPQGGFSYFEVLLSVVLLAVLLVPALRALETGIRDVATPSMAARPLLLRAKMEEVLAKPFPELYAETYAAGNTTGVNAKYSDAAGAADRRVVALYRYDPSAQALSGSDTGVVAVRVSYSADGTATTLSTLIGRWW